MPLASVLRDLGWTTTDGLLWRKPMTTHDPLTPPGAAVPEADAIVRTGDLYRFEVPTPAGHIVVIAPSDLTSDEADRAGRLVHQVLFLAVDDLPVGREMQP
jgi:hypothetical protein